MRTNLHGKNTKRVQRRKICIGKDFRLATQLDEFEIEDFMLDVGPDVNILPKNSLLHMGGLFHKVMGDKDFIHYLVFIGPSTSFIFFFM
jgi:hypothetical protein